jgi:cell division protein FtsX
MSKQDFYRNLHSTFKEKYILSEYRKKSITDEYELYLEVGVNADKTDGATLEDIISKIRAINGVTVVRTSDTSKMQNKKYDTIIYFKYNPDAFNAGVSLYQQHEYIKQQIKKIPGITINRETPAPGKLVRKGDTNS